MSKLIEGLERDAIIRVTVTRDEEDYEYVVSEDILDEIQEVLNSKGIDGVIDFLDNNEKTVIIDISIAFKKENSKWELEMLCGMKTLVQIE